MTQVATAGTSLRDVPLLEARGVTKAFPGCLANDSISFAIGAGRIHALLGENGAGKSTLVKIMYGVLEPDAGEIFWEGGPAGIDGPASARRKGIGMVFQHFSLFESMTVLENIGLAMNDERDMKRLRERVAEVSQSYGLPLDMDRHVVSLSVGERQRIEIVRCLIQEPRLLILDEPTSVLTPQEVERLFETLGKLSDDGCAILYISHKLDEVRALCHGATILRGGRVVAECDPREETSRGLAELMIGEKVVAPERKRQRTTAGDRLVASAVSVPSSEQFGVDLLDISFTVGGGDILGIAGVAGNGQKELMKVLTGETAVPDSPNAIRFDGTDVAAWGPVRRRQCGGAFIPEERNGHAAVPVMTLRENAFLTTFRGLGLSRRGLILEGKTRRYAEDVIVVFDVRTTGAEADAASLSGGNMQKFVVGREINLRPGILIVAQPTWGVDAGAVATIHQALIDLAEEGAAVLVISQDLDEIFAICDEIAVISGGRLSPARPIGDVTVEEIGLLMGGTA